MCDALFGRACGCVQELGPSTFDRAYRMLHAIGWGQDSAVEVGGESYDELSEVLPVRDAMRECDCLVPLALNVCPLRDCDHRRTRCTL